jgi:hypothetical protein
MVRFVVKYRDKLLIYSRANWWTSGLLNIGKEYYPDRLCGLVVRVSGYRYRGLGFDPRRYQIF